MDGGEPTSNERARVDLALVDRCGGGAADEVADDESNIEERRVDARERVIGDETPVDVEEEEG